MLDSMQRARVYGGSSYGSGGSIKPGASSTVGIKLNKADASIRIGISFER